MSRDGFDITVEVGGVQRRIIPRSVARRDGYTTKLCLEVQNEAGWPGVVAALAEATEAAESATLRKAPTAEEHDQALAYIGRLLPAVGRG
jgi:hypothetical protein